MSNEELERIFQEDNANCMNEATELANGVGVDEITTVEINKLFEDLYSFKIENPMVILNLHSWVLYHKGIGEKPPYFMTSLDDVKRI